jgi:hypothetical protein
MGTIIGHGMATKEITTPRIEEMVRGAVTLIIRTIMMGMEVEEMAPMEIITIRSAITTTAENVVTKPSAQVATTTII